MEGDGQGGARASACAATACCANWRRRGAGRHSLGVLVSRGACVSFVMAIHAQCVVVALRAFRSSILLLVPTQIRARARARISGAFYAGGREGASKTDCDGVAAQVEDELYSLFPWAHGKKVRGANCVCVGGGVVTGQCTHA